MTADGGPRPFSVQEGELDLLDKRELQIRGVRLAGADLNVLADVASDVLALERREILVTDYVDEVLTFDVLRATIYPHMLLDRAAPLLEAIGAVAGVTLAPDARVESRGVLGWIAADSADVGPALAAASASAEALLAAIDRRVLVLSTGAEVVGGQIVDTNAATITARLGAAGLRCEHGGAVRDDADLIAGTVRSWVGRGVGMVITTGGVGAEAKDCTVEAVLKLDAKASTPYIARFEPGHGRHVKDGVRIAVGRHAGARIVCLPGPNDEVVAALDVLVDGLAAGLDDEALAERIAARLRGVLRDKMPGHRPGPPTAPPVRRITKELLAGIPGVRRGLVVAAEAGVVAGIGLLDSAATPDPAGTWTALRADGDIVGPGTPLVEVTGTAWELAVAEDHVLGALGFAGGLAARARQLQAAAPPGLRIVCGGWKKLPAAQKPLLRAALDVAGIGHRLLPGEFVYVDKNVVTLLGGVQAAVQAGRRLEHGPVAVQVTDVEAAVLAAAAGSGVVMVDNGDLATLRAVAAELRAGDGAVVLAFAGGLGPEDLEPAFHARATIVDIGRAILDAPLWDLRFTVDGLGEHGVVGDVAPPA